MKQFVLFLCVLTCLVSTAYSKEVNIIMKDGNLIKGELVGINEEVVFLKASKNKTRTIKLETVNEIFDSSTGERIAIGKQQKKNPVPSVPGAGNVVPEEVDSNLNKTWMFVFGNLQSGLVGYVPCQPLEGIFVPGSAYVNGMLPYDLAWGAGVGIEYKLTDWLAGAFEFSMSSWEKLLANKDGYGVGDWIWEQSGYSDARIGPFPMDVKYYMDTVAMRLGIKYYPWKGIAQPWAGASMGMYSWQATIGNREEGKKYSDISSDIAYSTSFQVGVDFVLSEIVIRLYGDFATAVANPVFENLFQDGWNFENSGGEHVEGPYRVGIAIGMGI